MNRFKWPLKIGCIRTIVNYSFKNNKYNFRYSNTAQIQTVLKWQSKMDNPEKLATLGTQDEDTKKTHSFTFFGNK